MDKPPDDGTDIDDLFRVSHTLVLGQEDIHEAGEPCHTN